MTLFKAFKAKFAFKNCKKQEKICAGDTLISNGINGKILAILIKVLAFSQYL